MTEAGDHYDPIDRTVRLLPDHHAKSSLAAVTIAAHEVGHAIQDAEGYPDRYYIRYAESEEPEQTGSLVDPFEGNHGWYWLNVDEEPITIQLEVHGYYNSIEELFRSYQ